MSEKKIVKCLEYHEEVEVTIVLFGGKPMAVRPLCKQIAYRG